MLNYKINSYTRQAAPLSQTKVNKLTFEADFPGGSAWESKTSMSVNLIII
jgi:hypothetical protein